MRKILFFLFVCWGTIGMGVAQEQVKISRFQGERVTGLDISDDSSKDSYNIFSAFCALYVLKK